MDDKYGKLPSAMILQTLYYRVYNFNNHLKTILALCECERIFAQTLSLVEKSTIDTGTFGFESDFDADAMCRWGGGSPKLECCWDGNCTFFSEFKR